MVNVFMKQTITLDVPYFRQASLKGRILKVVQGQVHLFGASGSCDIAENEESDELAKKGYLIMRIRCTAYHRPHGDEEEQGTIYDILCNCIHTSRRIYIILEYPDPIISLRSMIILDSPEVQVATNH